MTPGLVAAASDEAVYLSKTLSKILSEVYAQPKAVLIDLGPAIGSNISYLGERVGCKIHVEDLHADLDRHAREGMFNRLPEFLETPATPSTLLRTNRAFAAASTCGRAGGVGYCRVRTSTSCSKVCSCPTPSS